MRNTSPGGFALLEVVVAVALLTISTLVIVEALGAAIEYTRAAEQARLGIEAAAAVADTLRGGVAYPTGWRAAGSPGPDGIPGTGDDGPPVGPAALCRRQIDLQAVGGRTFAWIEVDCLPGNTPGGRLARSIVLVRVMPRAGSRTPLDAPRSRPRRRGQTGAVFPSWSCSSPRSARPCSPVRFFRWSRRARRRAGDTWRRPLRKGSAMS